MIPLHKGSKCGARVFEDRDHLLCHTDKKVTAARRRLAQGLHCHPWAWEYTGYGKGYSPDNGKSVNTQLAQPPLLSSKQNIYKPGLVGEAFEANVTITTPTTRWSLVAAHPNAVAGASEVAMGGERANRQHPDRTHRLLKVEGGGVAGEWKQSTQARPKKTLEFPGPGVELGAALEDIYQLRRRCVKHDDGTREHHLQTNFLRESGALWGLAQRRRGRGGQQQKGRVHRS